VATPELNEAAARKSSNPANPRTGQHGSANSCLPLLVPLSELWQDRGGGSTSHPGSTDVGVGKSFTTDLPFGPTAVASGVHDNREAGGRERGA
jgi:hypothetical protein